MCVSFVMKSKIGLRIRELDGKMGGIQLSNRAYACEHTYYIYIIYVLDFMRYVVETPTRHRPVSQRTPNYQSINIIYQYSP